MGTIDFLHGPGCSVDLVCTLPTLYINTDVPGFANGTLQKAERGRREPVCVQGSSYTVTGPGLQSMRNSASSG